MNEGSRLLFSNTARGTVNTRELRKKKKKAIRNIVLKGPKRSLKDIKIMRWKDSKKKKKNYNQGKDINTIAPQEVRRHASLNMWIYSCHSLLLLRRLLYTQLQLSIWKEVWIFREPAEKGSHQVLVFIFALMVQVKSSGFQWEHQN